MSRFIDSQRADYGIAYATDLPGTGSVAAWLYKWRHGDASPRHARRVALTAEIKRLFAEAQGPLRFPADHRGPA